jgi:hypothetical protein
MPRNGKCMCDECVETRRVRQEVRHGWDGPEELPHRPRRKDTKKWCKGKIGRKHECVWRNLYLPGGRFWYAIYECTNCGKQRDWKFSE